MSLQRVTKVSNFRPKAKPENQKPSSVGGISTKPVDNIDILVKEVAILTEHLPHHVVNQKDAETFAIHLKNFLIDLILSMDDRSAGQNEIANNWAELTRSYNNLKFENGKPPIMGALWKQISTKLSNLTIKHSYSSKKIIHADSILIQNINRS